MSASKVCFLIDDDVDDQEIFSIALSDVDQSIVCVTANDGTDALEKINNDETFVPNFIFLDLNMIRMNGRECLAEIKKIHRLSHVPVIIYTTSSDPKDMQETKALGAAHFFTKPSDITVLTESLTAFFQNHK